MLESLDPIELAPDDARWLEFIANHPGSGIFHHPAWIGAVAGCYRYRPLVAALLDGGRVVAGLPAMEARGALRGHRMVSLPFSDHCAPLAGDESMLPALVAHLDRIRRARGCDRAEVAWELPSLPGVHSGPAMLLHATDLPPDPATLFAALHRTRVQQPIRSAESAGLVADRNTSWDDMIAFYALHLETRRRLGVPVQPLRFFRLVWERLVSRGMGFTMIVRREGKPVAGALFLLMNGTLTYKYGASLPEHWPDSPNHLLLWEAMRHAIELGCTRFDWGRTDPAHESLRDFKRGWGSREMAMRASVLADAPPPTRGPGRSLALAAHLIRRSPRWVCRAVGEMFYGQFA